MMTSEEREAAALAALPAFKARTLDPRVLHSTGDLGVPRIEKAPLTQPRSPQFATDARAGSRQASPEPASPKREFKAAPFNPVRFMSHMHSRHT